MPSPAKLPAPVTTRSDPGRCAGQQIERRVVAAGQGEHRLGVQEAAGGERGVGGDPRAAAVGQLDQARVGELALGVADRRRGGAPLAGQLADAGQLVTGPEFPRADPGGQLGADFAVPRHAAHPKVSASDMEQKGSAMRRFLGVIAVGLALVACGSPAAGPSAEKSLILATTTSTQDSGLLDELLPAFTTDTGWQVKTLAVGSGQAIELGRRGEADVLLVHSPAAEQKFVAEGSAGQRRLVMHNDFVLVGPAADPAGIGGTTSVQAMQKIAATQSVFVSRGDDSGTNAKEKDLWAKAAVAPGRGVVPVHRPGHG